MQLGVRKHKLRPLPIVRRSGISAGSAMSCQRGQCRWPLRHGNLRLQRTTTTSWPLGVGEQRVLQGEDPPNHQGGISVMMRDLQVSDKRPGAAITTLTAQLVKYELYFFIRPRAGTAPTPQDYLFKLLSHISDTGDRHGRREVAKAPSTVSIFSSLFGFILPARPRIHALAYQHLPFPFLSSQDYPHGPSTPISPALAPPHSASSSPHW